MNLVELIMACHYALKNGKDKNHVNNLFDEMGVNQKIQKEILSCFDENGMFIDGMNDTYEIEFNLTEMCSNEDNDGDVSGIHGTVGNGDVSGMYGTAVNGDVSGIHGYVTPCDNPIS